MILGIAHVLNALQKVINLHQQEHECLSHLLICTLYVKLSEISTALQHYNN